MSRALHVGMDEGAVIARCLAEKVGVSAIERLPQGGVRLVCMSSDGAALMRRKFKAHLISGDVARHPRRPRPIW